MTLGRPLYEDTQASHRGHTAVTQADVPASNGGLHVIDRVLLAPTR